MKAAIAQLEISLETLVTNEPINRAEGKTELADLEAVNAAEIRQSLAVLKAADAGPIWPVRSRDLFASFFICKETPPPENVRVVFFIMPYRCWAFGKMIGGEICLPTSPENAEAIYWSPLPLVPESSDSARNAIKESINERKS